MDTWQGKDCTPVTLNKYVYGNAAPTRFVDPSGNTGIVELNVTQRMQGILNSIKRGVYKEGRVILNETGCELLAATAEQVITQGIYVFTVGEKFYVGQSIDINKRIKQHTSNELKRTWKVVGKFMVNGGKDQLRIAEQYIMDLLEVVPDKKNGPNKIAAINKDRGRLRDEICEKRGK